MGVCGALSLHLSSGSRPPLQPYHVIAEGRLSAGR